MKIRSIRSSKTRSRICSHALRPLIAFLIVFTCILLGLSKASTAFGSSLLEPQEASIEPAPVPPDLAASTGEYDVIVSGEAVWTETGLDLQMGDRLLVTATGSVQLPLGQTAGPEGGAGGGNAQGSSATLPVSDAPLGALIARIGASDAAAPQLVGARKQFQVSNPGRLYLGVNESGPGELTASFDVHVEIQRGGATPTTQSQAAVSALIPPEILAKIPTRAGNSRSQPEDLVNVLIAGSEEELKQAFTTAGWVTVSRSRAKTLQNLAQVQALSEQAYLTRPLSELYLFGKPQDLGFADQMETVVHSRHYLRLWKSPYEVDGQTLWVGAAAHDTGPWRDSGTGEVGYRIGPNVDSERQLVCDTLNATGLVENFGYIEPSASAQNAGTSAGTEMRMDGRILVMTLLP